MMCLFCSSWYETELCKTLPPGKKLGDVRDVGDVGERNLRRFLTLTFLPGSICSTKKVGDVSYLRLFLSPTFLPGPMCSTKKVGDVQGLHIILCSIIKILLIRRQNFCFTTFIGNFHLYFVERFLLFGS